ncbi:CvfB family protein [Isobaculum melis]|uniref:S1 motif domain-containing protein n=1 Tax=Isobaculum melis TaxID=142588 RepID=A0A1H9R711_9LACT|nr:S1-like domain-containing RNA-binding protein [Isobaculum melis]SER68480.1 hypothetical protein SAMN04488559_10398 [Isobaculum melis]
MNESLGQVITGKVIDQNEKSFFIQKDGVTYRLDKTPTMSTYEMGDEVEGFAYVGMNKDFMLTQDIPAVQVGRYSWGIVTESRKDLGVFVNIGLPKEIVVSLDDLPTVKQLWPKKGDKLMVAIRVDSKDRMWGTLADEEMFHSLARKGDETLKNQNISGVAFRLKLIGTYILTEDYMLGFIHPSERKDEPRLGELVNGRVIGVRPDGILNVSLMPRAFEAIDDDAAMLLAILERTRTGSFPYTDKSDPDEIRERFGISKGQFKRALGNLMKQRMIVQEDGETKLVVKQDEG